MVISPIIGLLFSKVYYGFYGDFMQKGKKLQCQERKQQELLSAFSSYLCHGQLCLFSLTGEIPKSFVFYLPSRKPYLLFYHIGGLFLATYQKER